MYLIPIGVAQRKRGGPLRSETIESQGGLLQPKEDFGLLEGVHTKGANMNNGILTNIVEAQVPSVEVNEADDQTNAAHPIRILATGRKMHNGRMNNVCKIQWSNQLE